MFAGQGDNIVTSAKKGTICDSQVNAAMVESRVAADKRGFIAL